MWPFRRRRDNDEPAADSAEPAASARPDATTTPTPAPSPQAWRTLPAIQRTIGEAPHTARTEDIGDILTSWHSPALSGEIGHQVSADAPAGVLHGMATAVETGPSGVLPASTETGVLREPPHEHHQPDDEPGIAGPVAATASPAAPPAEAPISDRPVAAEAAPVRTLSTSPGPVPTVSRLAPPDVVPPRPVPALTLQRRGDAPSSAPSGAPALDAVWSPASGAAAPSDPGAEAATPASPAPPASDPPSPASPSAASPIGDATENAGETAPVAAASPIITPPTMAGASSAGPTLPPGAVLGPPIQPRSVQRRAADLPLPPVQRAADTPSSGAATASTDPTSTRGPGTTGEAASSEIAAAPAAGSTPAGGDPVEPGAPVAGEPARPAPGDHAAAQPAATEATDAGSTAPVTGLAAPLVQRTPEGHHPGDGHDHGGEDDATDGAGPDVQTLPLQRQAAPSARGPEAPTTVRPVGLGEPLVAPPTSPTEGDAAQAPIGEATGDPGATASLPLAASPAVQRSTDGNAGGPAAQSPPAAPATPTAAAPSEAAPSEAAPSAPLVPEAADPNTVTAPLVGERDSLVELAAPVADDHTTDPPGLVSGSPASNTSEALPLAAPSEPAPPPDVPTPSPVTVSTLREAPLVLQRSIQEGPPTLVGAPSHDPRPVPAVVGATVAARPTGSAARTGPPAGAPAVQRATLSSASVPGRPPASVLPHAPAGATRPSMTLASPPRPEVVAPSWPSAGEIAINNGVAQRMPDGSVQFTVQRDPTSGSGGPSVRDRVAQYEAMSGAPPSRPGSGPSITATASDAPPAPETGGNDRQQLEEQAKKLWPHIKRKLTNELQSGPSGRRPGW